MLVLDRVIELVASFLAVVVVLTCHEFAHAFVACRCGDLTAKYEGRLTLNPLKHFDLIGLICFTFVGFGWAKPVPINPDNFKNYRLGLGLTASAGILMNYIMAFLFYPIFLLLLNFMPEIAFLTSFLTTLFYMLYAYSLSFCVFNLLPFYPLDGFRIIDAASKWHGPVYRFLNNYGYYILLFLIVESFLCRIIGSYIPFMNYMNILGWVMEFAEKIFGFPIRAAWEPAFGVPFGQIWRSLLTW